jgi:type 1 fimbria pilin
MKLAGCLDWGRAQWARAMCLFMGALSMGHAQTSIPDQGTLVLSGTISKTTCVLNFGDAQSTLAGRKTLSFGSISTASIPATKDSGLSIAKPRLTTLLSVQNADGANCDGIGSGKWDVGISITDPTRVVTTSGGSKLLLSDGDRAASPRRFTEDIGVRLMTAVNASEGTLDKRVNFDVKNYTPPGSASASFTLLSDSSATAPGLSVSDKLAVTAEFLTTTAAATRSPGAYTVAIPLTVFYQ